MRARTPLPLDLLEQAQHQHGVVSRGQVVDGVGRSGLTSLLRAGMLARTLPGVYRLGGAPVSWRQRAMAACLSYGPPVAVSGASAVALHLGTVGPAGPVTVSVPPGRSGRRDGIRTLRRELPEGQVVLRHGIPVTSVERTICDQAASSSPLALRHLVDQLLAGRALTPGLADLAAAPQRRPAALRDLLGAYLGDGDDGATGPGPDSPAEEELRRWLIEAGLPVPVRQHQVVVGRAVYLLDLAYPEWLVAVEYDGWLTHGGLARFDHDRARSSELQLAGWLVVQVTRRHGRADITDRVGRALRAHGWAPG